MTNEQFALTLEEKAEQLVQDAKKQAQKLLDAAAVLRGTATVETHAESPVMPAPASRLDQIKEVVRSAGSLKTGEIIKRSNIPRGTVSSLLKPEHGFFKNEEGKWTLSG